MKNNDFRNNLPAPGAAGTGVSHTSVYCKNKNAKNAPLPQDILDHLGSPPHTGDGVHRWLFNTALRLHHYRDHEQIFELLNGAVANCGRNVPEKEILDAVINSRGAGSRSRTPLWPSLDIDKLRQILESNFSLETLSDNRVIETSADSLTAERAVDMLFPGNPLLCVGFDCRKFETKTKKDLGEALNKMGMIVPSAMSALRGQKADGTGLSMHTLDNTGPRQYLVVEFDNGTLDEQAKIIWHLGAYAPLVMVLHSGGKSLHGWFNCIGVDEEKIQRFFSYAVSLGADKAMWGRQQFARMPNGWRTEKACLQSVHFFNPSYAGLGGVHTDGGVEGLWNNPPVRVVVDEDIPDKVFPVPSGGISNTKAAERIFTVIAARRDLFVRGGDVVEIVEVDGAHRIESICARRFSAIVENYGSRVAGREESNSGVRWRTKTMPVSSSEVLLKTDQARRLPPIVQVCRSEIITPEGEILTKGYHDHGGGTYVTHGAGVPEVPLDVAKEALLGLLVDFDFATDADKSRAIAAMLSPALKMGGIILEDFPLDLSEADLSQSGKTYRQEITAALYGETPTAISQPKGGVGSLDEAVSNALLDGRPFIMIDNFRGQLDSTVLEMAIRGSGSIQCRGFRRSGTVDRRPFIWQMSTNGAVITRDLANRSIVTRIRKRPRGYQFKKWDEGTLKDHVQAHSSFFRGCIFTVVRAWLDAKQARTDETRHDFRQWVQSMDWMVQNLFALPPLLDGHEEQQARTASPALQWLREIAHGVAAANRLGQVLQASELASIGESAGIDLPGGGSGEKVNPRIGKMLARLYQEMESDVLTVDGFTVAREKVMDYSPHGPTQVKKYIFNK